MPKMVQKESLEAQVSRLTNELRSLQRRNRTPQRDEEVRFLSARVRDLRAELRSKRQKSFEEAPTLNA